nr:MAG TPA: hypothetical protein [Caudoviricetes sp.]
MNKPLIKPIGGFFLYSCGFSAIQFYNKLYYLTLKYTIFLPGVAQKLPKKKPGSFPGFRYAFFRYVLSASEISSFAVIPYAPRSSSISALVVDDTLIFAHSFFAPVLAS